MDSVLLRKTHFKLGDYKNPYSTTSMEQNKNIENTRSRSIATLDQNVKDDLRKSHFILGNFEPSYKTVFQTEFYNKANNNLVNPDLNAKAIEKVLRSHNYVLGSDKPEYKSETAAKYVAPDMSNRNLNGGQKISTQELQKSHYVFGNNADPWATTQQLSYNPKSLEMKKFTKDLTRTNFVFGEDKPDFKSVNQNTFIPHKISKNNEMKELSQDLRKHHFEFGREDLTGDNMQSINHQDFTNPTKGNHRFGAKLDNALLRASHFSLGDKSQAPPDQYATTYSQTMIPVQNPNPYLKKENISFKSSVIINGDGPSPYLTENRAKYFYIFNNNIVITSRQIKFQIKKSKK
jgi:hypothetical protein